MEPNNIPTTPSPYIPTSVVELPNPSGDRKKLFFIALPVLLILILVGSTIPVILKINERKQAETNGTLTIPAPTADAASVAPTTDYSNPFEEDSQYVNPFAAYKNPFDEFDDLQ